MLKKILPLLIFAALSTGVCHAQQYFTGTVEYKICIGIPKQDTIKIQCEYALHYMKLMPPSVDNSGEKIDEDVVMDWISNCIYVIKKGEKSILKKSLKEDNQSFRFIREYKYPDSVVNIAGIKGSLYNMMLTDSTSLDVSLADSLMLPVPAALRNHSDLFVFCQHKLLLKMQLTTIGKALEKKNSMANITITAENIKYRPANNTPWQLPADYKLIDESEQQRISDSIMREFKKTDSSLSASGKAINFDIDSALQAVKSNESLRKIVVATLQKQLKSGKKKKTNGTRQKQAARKP